MAPRLRVITGARADRLAPETQALVRVPGDGALTTPAPTLRVLAPQFLRWLRFVRERSANTVTAYTFDLETFVAFAEAHGLTAPAQVRVQHVEGYTAWLRQTKGLKAASANRHLHALRSFWKWMQREEIATRNPAADVALLRVPRRLPAYLTVAEQEHVLDALGKMIVPARRRAGPLSAAHDVVRVRTAHRDQALIATALLCGLRVDELSTLRLADVHLDAGVLRVRGKGDREREAVIIPRLAAILRDYIGRTRPVLLARRPSEYLFLAGMEGAARRGPQWRADGPVPSRNLYAMIRRRIEPILGRPVHPHMLRHSFASRLREHDAPIELIQEAMGHRQIATTMIYAHLSTPKRKADVARYLEGEQP